MTPQERAATELSAGPLHIKLFGAASKGAPIIISLIALAGVVALAYLIPMKIDRLEGKVDKLTEIMLMRR